MNLSDKIFDCPETGLKEELSSSLLSEELENCGFKVSRGVAGMSTAFVASYGSGKPAIGLLAEYDALAGCSQKKGIAVEEAVQKGSAGHACGHNLLGTGIIAAAAALKYFLGCYEMQGTILVYGSLRPSMVIISFFPCGITTAVKAVKGGAWAGS